MYFYTYAKLFFFLLVLNAKSITFVQNLKQVITVFKH